MLSATAPLTAVKPRPNTAAQWLHAPYTAWRSLFKFGTLVRPRSLIPPKNNSTKKTAGLIIKIVKTRRDWPLLKSRG